ncbi:MAG: hypothetical protein EBZ20_10935, partial [Rhodobacteraceae bacterium]|nr:hypothetical protein [Paracoccaceae bacterium]
KRILCGAVPVAYGVTPATSDTLKHILIETSRNETAQKRHAVDVEGCIMTTYCWVRQKSGEFQLLVVLSI